jgi:hypothetical protein
LASGDAAAALFPVKECLFGCLTIPRLDRKTLEEIEGYVDPIYRLAGGDPSEPLSPADLSLRLLGTKPTTATALVAPGTIGYCNGEWRIFIRKGTPWPRARWIAAHELAHWWFRRIGYAGPDLGARCDALGAALIVPRPVITHVRSRLGDDVYAIADELKTTQSLAFLRVSEVTGRPGAVVRLAGPIIRGEPCTWPVKLELATVKRARRRSIIKIAMWDEPNRIGVVAA